tara:strand:- start:21 stop:188 length:168 start_codon:yes stop_codon:yes gene_type:complete
MKNIEIIENLVRDKKKLDDEISKKLLYKIIIRFFLKTISSQNNNPTKTKIKLIDF